MSVLNLPRTNNLPTTSQESPKKPKFTKKVSAFLKVNFKAQEQETYPRSKKVQEPKSTKKTKNGTLITFLKVNFKAPKNKQLTCV